MAIDVGTFAGNFLQALTASRQHSQEQADAKVERDAKLKLFELQMKREQQQQTLFDQQEQARQQLFGMLSGGTAPVTPPNGIPDAQGPIAPASGAMPRPSLTELLADPKNALLLLQSGFLKGDDILKQNQMQQQRAMIERLLPGSGTGDAPGGLQLSALKVGPSGELMPDFEPPRAWQEVRSPDGKSFVVLDRQGRPLTTRPAAPNEMPQPTEEAKRVRDIDTALNLYEQAKQGLLSGLSGTATGPLIGKLPAITSSQQTAQGSVAAMAPVLKQLFRAAGEGVFTDKDQELLIQMIPTRETNPDARKAMLDNIDAIVRAKLGIGAQQRANVVDFNSLPP